MRYHTLDEDLLHSLPGNFTLQAEVPEHFNVPLNADGTVAEMTATFEGETLFGSTSVAAAVGKNTDNLIEAMITAATERLKLATPLKSDDFKDLHERVLNGEDLMETEDEDLMQEFSRYFKEYIGWERMHMNLSAKTSPDSDEEYALKLSLNAPGYGAMLNLLQYVTDSETLTSVIASFMPLDETMHGEQE